MRWFLIPLVLLLSACPDSRRPPPPPQPDPPPAEAAPSVVASPTGMKALRAVFEADLAAFKANPTRESWDAAIASLDALETEAQDALETSEALLEDYLPVARDELVVARPTSNQAQEPAQGAGSGKDGSNEGD